MSFAVYDVGTNGAKDGWCMVVYTCPYHMDDAGDDCDHSYKLTCHLDNETELIINEGLLAGKSPTQIRAGGRPTLLQFCPNFPKFSLFPS